MFKEFKEFAIKGNVIDMAVGVIIGASFGKIVSSLVADVIMPPIGVLLGGIDFTSFSMVLKKATETEPAILLNYGSFLNNIFDFVIIAFVIFIMVKQMNKLKRKEKLEEAVTGVKEIKEEVLLLREIRDELKK